MNYKEFLESKKKNHVKSGFAVSDSDLNDNLFPFQAFIVKRALEAGKYAIFADCGLGKTFMQLEWAHHVVMHTGLPVLILAPLAVAGQTIAEGAHWGIPVMKYYNEMNTMESLSPGIYISNYEQLDNIPTSDFSGIVLDESSILKNYEGAIKKQISLLDLMSA